MPLITNNDVTILLNFLEDLSERFGNAGCNDMELPDTPENRSLIEEALEPGETFTVVGNKLLTSDFIVLDAIRNRLAADYGIERRA